MNKLVALLALVTVPTASSAAIQTRTVDYKDGDVVLQGFLAYDDAKVKPGSAPVPGVLIVHQWMGLTDNERNRAHDDKNALHVWPFPF